MKQQTTISNATHVATVVLAVLCFAVVFTGCSIFGPDAIYETASIAVSVGADAGPSGSVVRGAGVPSGGAQYAIGSTTSPDEIDSVILTIAGENRFGVYQDPLATLTLTGSGASWGGTVPSLPLGPSLTFTVEAFDAADTLIYSGSTTTALSALQLTVALVLLPFDDATTTVGFPVIRQITRPAQIVEGSTELVSVDLEGSTDETLLVEVTTGGGGFAPASSPGSPILVPLAGTAATLDLSYNAPDDAPATYVHSLKAENEQGNSVTRQFTTTVVWETADAGITIGGIAPAVTGFSLALDAAGDLVLTAVVSDDGPMSEISYQWSYDGGLSFSDPQVNPATLAGYDEAATGTVNLTVTDSDTSIVSTGLSTTVSFLLPAGLFPDVVESEPSGSVWTIINLGEGHQPQDVGDGGVVIGYIDTGAGYQSFRWAAGVPTYLDPPAGSTSAIASGVNAAGDVAGYGFVGGSLAALLWPAGSNVPQDLGDLPGSIVNADARAVNDLGHVTGSSFAAEGRRAFYWDGSPMVSVGALPAPSSSDSTADDINNLNQIVGVSRVASDASHAFLWDPTGGIQDLGVLPLSGHTISYGRAINDAGVVVGESHNNSDQSVPYRWTQATGMESLGELPGYSWSAASDINESEFVVGGAWDTTFSESRAWIWSPAGGIEDLNDRLADSAGWVLTWANAVNDSDWIVGVGINPSGFESGFLAVPE